MLDHVRLKSVGLLFFLTFLSFICFGSAALYAGIVVQPDSTELIVTAGKDTAGVFQVHNDGNDAVHVKVELEDWPKNNAPEYPVLVNKWLSVTPLLFDLGAGESREVAYTINVPSANVSEVIAMVFFGTTAPQGNFNITSRYGVSLYAALSEKIKLDCAIKDLSIEPNFLTTDTGKVNKGIIFTITIENKGNVHLRPTGNISITAQDGAKYDIPILRDFPAYAGGDVKLRILWNKTDIAPGKYDALVILDYGKLYNQNKKIEKPVAFTVNNDGSVAI